MWALEPSSSTNQNHSNKATSYEVCLQSVYRFIRENVDRFFFHCFIMFIAQGYCKITPEDKKFDSNRKLVLIYHIAEDYSAYVYYYKKTSKYFLYLYQYFPL